MRILALETSAKAVSAAVTEDGKVLCSGYQDTGLTHSRTLMPIVALYFVQKIIFLDYFITIYSK